MKMLRTAVAVGTVSLLTAGYALSQFRYLQGEWQQHAEQMDKPQIAYLATFLLLLIVVLAFIKEPEAGES